MNLPTHIKEWFASRTVSEQTLADFNIGWNGKRIIFPIYSPTGEYLFSKYRRDPASEEGPKYTYEAGATAALYGAHRLNEKHFIIICEGEGDLLTLYSHGYTAVTSTGGAGTFKDEWIELLTGKDLYVCYDNDEAGLKGAVKLLTKLPAKMVLVPRAEGVKDITNYIQTGGSFPILLEQAQSFPVLSDPIPEFKFIKDVEEQKKKYKYALEHLMVQERNAKNSGKFFWHFDAIRELFLTALDNLEREIRKMRYFKKPVNVEDNDGRITNEDVLRAKEVPIENFLKINHAGFAHCPLGHTDKTPSLKVYRQQNKWFCFSCSSGTDVIDLIQKMESCDFITAVKKLINK